MTASSRGFDEELRARLASLARALRSYYMYVHVFVACCMLVPILESILKLGVIFFLTTGIDFEACRDLFPERLYDFFLESILDRF